MKKRGLAVALIVTLLVTGCSSVKGGGDTQPVAQAPVNEDGTVDIWAKYENPVTVSMAVESTSDDLKEGDTWEDNVWTRGYEEKFNIDIAVDWVSNEYDTKLNLAITSKDLPDVFAVNLNQLLQLMDAGLIYDMTEVFEQYASDTVKGYREADPAMFEIGTRDGRLYGLPKLYYGLIDRFHYVWIRKDWKEEQGLGDPKTMEDLENMALKFMDAYGGYGIACNRTLSPLYYLAEGYGAYNDFWEADENGSLALSMTRPEMKTALAKFSDWYGKGILKQDFITQDEAAMVEDVISGQVGIVPFWQWFYMGADVVESLGKDALFQCYRIPTETGENIPSPLSFTNCDYIVVNKKCKNPEAIIKMINFYAYVMDDSHGELSEDDIRAFTAEDQEHTAIVRIINPNTDYDQYASVAEALKTGDASKLKGNARTKYDDCITFIENENPPKAVVGNYLQQGDEKCSYALGKKILDEKLYVKSALWGPKPDVYTNYGSTLNDILLEGFTKIIIKDQPVDYFDELVQNWKDAGGEDVTQAVNEMYGTK